MRGHSSWPSERWRSLVIDQPLRRASPRRQLLHGADVSVSHAHTVESQTVQVHVAVSWLPTQAVSPGTANPLPHALQGRSTIFGICSLLLLLGAECARGNQNALPLRMEYSSRSAVTCAYRLP